MKRCIALCSLLASINAPAQVFEESFESGFSSWTEPCVCGMPQLSTDTPGGTGAYSLQVTAEHWLDAQCSQCPVTLDLYSSLAWLPAGPYTLSYWVKGHGSNGPPATVKVCHETAGSYPPLTSLWGEGNYTTAWAYYEESFLWDGVGPPDLVLVLAAGASMDGPLITGFDAIQITSISTAIQDGLGTPAYRMDPEHLWLHMPATLTHVELIDAAGRACVPESVRHSGRTLEVGIGRLPAGMYVLRIASDLGAQQLRFVKP